MRIGAVFPQTELGGDAGAVRAYGQRVEELSFASEWAFRRPEIVTPKPCAAPAIAFES